MQNRNNTSTSAPTPDIIFRELDFDRYLQSGDELEKIKTNALSALKKMIEEPTNYREHIESTRQFLSALWEKYDCENIVKVFEAFTKIEPVLIDMEREEGVGFRYRDHSVHTYHVFTFGLRLITKLIDKVGDDEAQKMLKVKPENISSLIPSFRDYDYKERLFYLWCLMSTFHDIAIPLEHLDIIRNGLQSFSEEFGLNITGPHFRQDIMDGDMDRYFELLSKIYQSEITLDEKGLCYKQDEKNQYVKNLLAHKFSNNDHGVLGGFMMYKTMEKTFLLGKSDKHAFNEMDLFNNYSKYVLTQDIARASLGISLHNLKRESENKGPLCLPLHFDKYPLTFILILSDGIQEYLRWEGSSIRGGTKLVCFPDLKLEIDSSKPKLEVEYYLSSETIEQEFFIQQAEHLARALGNNIPENSLQAATILCSALSRELTKQISLDGEFTLMLRVVQDDEEIYSQKVI